LANLLMFMEDNTRDVSKLVNDILKLLKKIE